MPIPRVELREVTKANLAQVIRLKVRPDQEKFVADNTRSVAQAYVSPGRALPRAIYADGELVGFTMLDLVRPDHPDAKDGQSEYWLWRLMIGAEHQGKGYGRAALREVIAYIKTLPDARWVQLSYVPAEGNPSPLYISEGFRPTGEVDDGEVIMRLTLN